MSLAWKQQAGNYPLIARTAKGTYEIARYIGSYGPRFLGWLKSGKDVQAVSDMTGDLDAVKSQCERHADET